MKPQQDQSRKEHGVDPKLEAKLELKLVITPDTSLADERAAVFSAF